MNEMKHGENKGEDLWARQYARVLRGGYCNVLRYPLCMNDDGFAGAPTPPRWHCRMVVEMASPYFCPKTYEKVGRQGRVLLGKRESGFPALLGRQRYWRSRLREAGVAH